MPARYASKPTVIRTSTSTKVYYPKQNSANSNTSRPSNVIRTSKYTCNVYKK